jgi:hypothetical protein
VLFSFVIFAVSLRVCLSAWGNNLLYPLNNTVHQDPKIWYLTRTWRIRMAVRGRSVSALAERRRCGWRTSWRRSSGVGTLALWTVVSQWSVSGMDEQTDMQVELEMTLPITALRHSPCHSVWNLQWWVVLGPSPHTRVCTLLKVTMGWNCTMHEGNSSA